MTPRKHKLRIVLELQWNHKTDYVMAYLIALLYEANMVPSPTDPCGSVVRVGTITTFEWELIDAPIEETAWQQLFYEVRKRLRRSFAGQISVDTFTVTGEMQLAEDPYEADPM